MRPTLFLSPVCLTSLILSHLSMVLSESSVMADSDVASSIVKPVYLDFHRGCQAIHSMTIAIWAAGREPFFMRWSNSALRRPADLGYDTGLKNEGYSFLCPF